jgi:hypothetical protein
MLPCPEGKSLNKRPSQSMISPLGRDIYVQMCRVVSADVTDGLEIFNVIEMNKLHRIFEAAGEIPDDVARLIKRDKKTSPVVGNIPPERALAKRRSLQRKYRLSLQGDQQNQQARLLDVLPASPSFILQLGALVPGIFRRAGRVWSLT